MKIYQLLVVAATTLVLFHNADAAECERWQPLPFDSKGKMHEECRPQVLYSWLTDIDVIDSSDANWPVRRGKAFFSRTPLSSFFYGQYSYRVKLKPNLNYVLDDSWEKHAGCYHSEREKKNTVYIWTDPNVGYTEYVLCSNEPIESWSYAMPEHYAEMLKEKTLVEALGKENVDGLMNPSSAGPYSCPSCFLGYWMPDRRNDGTLEELMSALKYMQATIKKNIGKVFVPDTGNIYSIKNDIESPEIKKHFAVEELIQPFMNDAPAVQLFSRINIVSAQSNDQDVKLKVQEYCDSKSCDYKIAQKFLGGQGEIKSFDVSWQCCDVFSKQCNKQQYAVSLNDTNLEGYRFRFGCTDSGQAVAVKTSATGPELKLESAN